MNSKAKLPSQATKRKNELHQPTLLESFAKKTKKPEHTTPITIEFEKSTTNNQNKVQSQLTSAFGLQKPTISSKEPPHWHEVWDLISQMRAETPAPVDSKGCHALADHIEPKENRFQTLVGLMLSAQTKDEITGATMKILREYGLTVDHIIETPTPALDKLISKCTYHEKKAKYIKDTAVILKNKYDGDIPDTLEGLVELPGVGNKMALLCLHTAWKKNIGIGVDVHVHRICNRLGWVHNTKTPEKTRQELEQWLPVEYWEPINRMLVGFGQTVCKYIPRCHVCKVNHLCPSAFKEIPKEMRPTSTDETCYRNCICHLRCPYGPTTVAGTNNMPLTDLPKDNILDIFSHLSSKDLFSVSRVCKSFHDWIKQNFKRLFRFADSFNIVVFGHQGYGKTTFTKNLVKDIVSNHQVSLKYIFPPIHSTNQLSLLAQLDVPENPKTSPSWRMYFLEAEFSNRPSKTITLIDVPVKQKLKELKIGCFVAHLGILLLSADDPAPKYGNYDLIGQQLFTSFIAGVKELIVVANKMDAVNYEEDKYTALVTAATPLLKRVGYLSPRLHFVGASALDSRNLARPGQASFETECVFDRIKKCMPDKISIDLVKNSPLRGCVMQVLEQASQTGTVLLVYIQSGILISGNQVIIAPLGIKSRIVEIRFYNEQKLAATPGNLVIGTFLLEGDIVTVLLGSKEKIERGSVILSEDARIIQAKKITGQIISLKRSDIQYRNMLNELSYEASFFIHTCEVQCKITKIIALVDRKSPPNAPPIVVDENPRRIRRNECALVTIEPKKPLFVDEFSMKTLPGKLGRFGWKDSDTVGGAGIVKSIDE